MKLCMGCMENIDDHITTCPYCGYDETTLRQESFYLDPGTVVGGKYIVGRVISYGGYTITYLGMDAENHRKVMVKEYLPSDYSTRSDGETEVTIYSGDAVEQFEQGLTTFLNEANRIQHLENVQGIAKVYDCMAENDTGYVISEYVEGQTLKEILDSGKIFTPQEAKDLISQILVGLSQVHPLDIIHCDISPETIMITSTGEIKLMDFGAARYVTTANSKSLAIILKQGYAPEEQYRSKGIRGPWTDVYALGAVMYRMITGKVPAESVDRALVDELKEPSKLGIAIPQNMENAVMNALNVYQIDRTPSAEVFLRELNSPQVKRIQVKRKKNDTGKFPKWAKGLVAGLLCVVLAGGAYIAFNLNLDDRSSNNQNGGGKRLQLSKIENQSYKAFEKYWKEDLGLKMEELSIIYEYDKDIRVDKVTRIVQEKMEEKDSDLLVVGTKVQKLQEAQKEGKLRASVYVKSAVQFSIKEEWLKLYPTEEEAPGRKIKKEQKATSQPYGTIKSIVYDGKIYDIERQKKDLLKLICQVGTPLQFNIYTGEYYKCPKEIVKKIKKGKYISNFKFQVWKEGPEPEREEIPRKIVSDEYYSFKHGADYIVEIEKDAFSANKDFDQSISGISKVFYTVKKKFNKGMTIGKLKQQVPGLKLKDNKEKDITAKENDCLIQDCDKDCFKSGDTLKLTLSQPETQTSEPTKNSEKPSTPTPDDGSRKRVEDDGDGVFN